MKAIACILCFYMSYALYSETHETTPYSLNLFNQLIHLLNKEPLSYLASALMASLGIWLSYSSYKDYKVDKKKKI